MSIELVGSTDENFEYFAKKIKEVTEERDGNAMCCLFEPMGNQCVAINSDKQFYATAAKFAEDGYIHYYGVAPSEFDVEDDTYRFVFVFEVFDRDIVRGGLIGKRGKKGELPPDDLVEHIFNAAKEHVSDIIGLEKNRTTH